MTSVRTLIAGLGSSGSLLAAVIAAFLVLGAIVAFKGLPGGTAGAPDGTVIVDSTAPEAAAFAAATPGATPAADPTPVPAAVLAELGLDVAGGPGEGGGAGDRDGTIDQPAPGSGSGPAPGSGPGPEPPAPGPAAGLIGNANGAVRDSTGIDLGLDQATKPITDVVDETLKSVTGGAKGSGDTLQGITGGRSQGSGLLELP